MRTGHLLCLLWLSSGLIPVWAAVVPDASVVEPDTGAPRLPGADPQSRRSPFIHQTPVYPDHGKSSATAQPVKSGQASQATSSLPGSSGAFPGQNQGDLTSSGEAQPLKPLAPVSSSSSRTIPLWAALILFFFLAIGGFTLARSREQP